ncbi:MAG: BON domain-containing protein [Candidatus Binatia bacterium]
MKRLDWIGAGVLCAVLSLPAALTAAEGPPDAWLTTKAKVAMLTSIGTKGSIHVDTLDGKMTLYGKVPTAEDKAKAEETARKIEGVKEVRNLLQVVPAEQAKAVEASDAATEKAVKEALKKEEALKGSNISVQSVDKGTVLLAGKADNLATHLRAIEVTRGVSGVRSVKSEIESPQAKADSEIWRKLDAAKSKSGDTAGSMKDKMASTAHDAKEGAKKAAGSTTEATRDAASDVSGAMRDMYITSAAKMRLLADRDTPGLDINVDTENGVVTLFGTVPTKEAKAKAEEEARKVAGVKRVVNELQVASAGKVGAR